MCECFYPGPLRESTVFISEPWATLTITYNEAMFSTPRIYVIQPLQRKLQVCKLDHLTLPSLMWLDGHRLTPLCLHLIKHYIQTGRSLVPVSTELWLTTS